MSQSNEIDQPANHVDLTVLRKPACRVQLEVRAKPSLIDLARKDALKKVNKETPPFPGYRKGHTPSEILEKKYPGEIERQMHTLLANRAFALAQQQIRIPILPNTSVNFDLKKCSPHEGAELHFSFETEPEVPSINPKEFKPEPVPTEELTEQQIDEAIRQMTFFFAKWTPVVDRGIQEGDFIVINLDTLEEGKEPERVFSEVRFEVSAQRMATWMKQLVIGSKIGDILEGVSEPDSDASEEDKQAFQPKKVRVQIQHVESVELPEINEEFLQKIGSKDTEDMRQSVRMTLQKNLDDKSKEAQRQQVNRFLEGYAIELPLSLIDAEVRHRKNQALQDPSFKTQWDKMPADERKKAEERFYTESTQAVRLFYLSRQVVRDAEIPITRKEVQDEAAKSQNQFGHKVQGDNIPKEAFALALSKIILTKAQDYIIEMAQNTPSEQPLESPAPAEPLAQTVPQEKEDA